MSLLSSYEDYEEGVFSDPVLLYSEGEPRILDTIFNVSSLTTSGIFNNTLFQTAGIIILGIILFGEFNETTNQVFTFSTTCGKGQVGGFIRNQDQGASATFEYFFRQSEIQTNRSHRLYANKRAKKG